MLGVGGKDLGLYALQLATFTLKSILRMDKHHKIEMAHIQARNNYIDNGDWQHAYILAWIHITRMYD